MRWNESGLFLQACRPARSCSRRSGSPQSRPRQRGSHLASSVTGAKIVLSLAVTRGARRRNPSKLPWPATGATSPRRAGTIAGLARVPKRPSAPRCVERAGNGSSSDVVCQLFKTNLWSFLEFRRFGVSSGRGQSVAVARVGRHAHVRGVRMGVLRCCEQRMHGHAA